MDVDATFATGGLKVFSGECCLCNIGIPVGHFDESGHPLHTGDIVVVLEGRYIGKECEFWSGGDSLTAIVANQFQSYSNGSIRIDDLNAAPFVMGIKDAGFDSPEWRVRLVKKFSDVVEGENWPQFGFSYHRSEIADQAISLASDSLNG